jgi:hypothetical protein
VLLGKALIGVLFLEEKMVIDSVTAIEMEEDLRKVAKLELGWLKETVMGWAWEMAKVKEMDLRLR